jgi:hypothetical protein
MLFAFSGNAPGRFTTALFKDSNELQVKKDPYYDRRQLNRAESLKSPTREKKLLTNSPP